MSTINKPLPHRPFSLAVEPHKAPRRQHQPQMTPVSLPRPYVLAPVPKRSHLVTRSPSPPYHHHRAASDALPSSRHMPSHSFSESQVRYNPHSSTSDLVPPHLKQTRSPSFWRRHWFVILIFILAASGITVAVVVVLRGPRSAGVVYTPDSVPSPSSSSSSVFSEPSIGTASPGSATRSTATTSASSTTRTVSGGPLPSAAPSNPS